MRQRPRTKAGAWVRLATPWIAMTVGMGLVVTLFNLLLGIPSHPGPPDWHADNRTGQAILITIGSSIREVVAPHTLGRYVGIARSDAPTLSEADAYPMKAYVFLEGEGEVRTTRGDDGSRVVGGRGELVYCEAFSWSELKSAAFTVVVERNVAPGIFDELADPCPSP